MVSKAEEFYTRVCFYVILFLIMIVLFMLITGDVNRLIAAVFSTKKEDHKNVLDDLSMSKLYWGLRNMLC